MPKAESRIPVSTETRRRLKVIKADRDARSYDQVLRSILDDREKSPEDRQREA